MSSGVWSDTWSDLWSGGPVPSSPTLPSGTPPPESGSPFRITLFDKDFARVGWLNDPIVVKASPKHMAIGTTEITVADNHRRLGQLTAKGARVLIEYRGEFCMSGIVRLRAGRGPGAGTVTATIDDDFWLLHRMLGWPVPGAAIDAQGTKQDTRTGPAETVAKGFISANKGRMIDPITVAADLGRGADITVSSRMMPLADQLVTAVDKAGVGITVRHSLATDGLVVDAYEPATYPHTLSPEAATIISYEWSEADPTMTQAIIGGPNENTSREFRRLVSTTLEALYGYSFEGFVDAKQTESSSERDEAGQAALDAAVSKGSFKVELSESGAFHYGGPGGVHLGDLVPVEIAGHTLTDVLREVTINFDRENGLVVTPVIGERTDDPDLNLARLLANLATGIRNLRTR